MNSPRLFTTALLLALGLTLAPCDAKPPSNFRTENLVAWCIVPFDAKKRGPRARAEMLVELGLKRCAYDWRYEHVPTFEDEILQYKRLGIEYFAFWSEHDEAFNLFRKHRITPQVWRMVPAVKGESHEEKLEAAAAVLTPLAQRLSLLNCKLSLYNHGGWGGEPKTMVDVCKSLHAKGHKHVGIAYNFHHGHEHIHEFPKWLALMKPYLHCLNLNGMADPETVKAGKRKIIPIGTGEHEREMIATIIKSGYRGPIGILGHVASEDVKVTLTNNLTGLKNVLAELEKN